MKLKKFRKEFGGLPVDMKEFAHTVVSNLEPDCAESQVLFDTAHALVDAFDEFESAMEDAEVELG